MLGDVIRPLYTGRPRGRDEGIAADHHPLFAGVDLEALGCRFIPRRAGRRTLVCGPQLPPSIIAVLSGVLHAYALTPDGRSRLVLEVLGAGDVDGMLTSAGFASHMSETITEAQYIVIPGATVTRLMAASPRFASNLYSIALQRLVRREAHMAALSERSGIRAVARQLLALAEYAGTRDRNLVVLSPRPTHQLLADMLGLRRETVTLSLRTLRALGIVRLDPQTIEIDVVKLSNVLNSSTFLHGNVVKDGSRIA